MFNIFDKNKPFKDNDRWLTLYYWVGIIILFLFLAIGEATGLVMFFFAHWRKALSIIVGTAVVFWVLYIAHMVFVGFLVDIKTIRNKIYSLENNNKEFYDDDESEVRVSKETEELYRSPRKEKSHKEYQGMSKPLKIALIVICLLVLVGAIVGGIIVS